MEMQRGCKINTSVQLLKIICAILVVNIHLPSCVQECIVPICRIAVPIFYFITGYYLLGSFELIRISKITNSVLKHAKLYIIGILAYGITAFVNGGVNMYDMKSALCLIGRILFIGDGVGKACHLWYLLAFIQAALLIIFAIKSRTINVLYVIATFGFIGSLILGRYSFLIPYEGIESNLLLCRNALTTALPCLLIGACLRKHSSWFNTVRSVRIVCCSLVMLYVEHFVSGTYVNSMGDMYIFTIPLAIGVFTVCMNVEIKLPQKILNLLNSNVSLHLYLWHLLVADVITKILVYLIGGIPVSVYSFFIIFSCLIIFMSVSRSWSLIKRNVSLSILKGYKSISEKS